MEIKNLNTISGVKNGVEYEIRRQTKVIKEGGTIIQETRRWNPEQKYTTPCGPRKWLMTIVISLILI